MAGELSDNRGGGQAQWNWPAIHPEGRKFGLIAVAIALFVLIVLDFEVIGWLLMALAVWIFAFFRDPQRVVPQGDDLVVSPADGLVTLISKVPPPPELQRPDSSGSPGLGAAPVTRVSIFMSVFDVHINRSPVGGIVQRIVYIPGKFANAELDKASEDNERQHVLVEKPDGRIVGFTQIAGLLARRIVPFIKPGDIVAPGQRIGLIRFGSRVDVYLPVGTGSSVLLGQRVVGGETVLAKLGQEQFIDGVRQ